MPMFEVEYEYPIIEEGTITVEADNVDDAETQAIAKVLDQLSYELPQEVNELDLFINTIKEVKPNA